MDILKELQEIVSNYRGITTDLNEETTFDMLGFDSLDKVEIMMMVEDKFGITFSDDMNITSLADLITEIKTLIG